MLKLGTDSGRTIRIRSQLSIPRAVARHRVSIPGKLIVSCNGSFSINCLIVDLSTDGARLELGEDCQLPDNVLLFESYKQNIYECRLRWQEKRSAGLSFVDLYSQSARRALVEDCSLGLLDAEEH